MAELRPSRNQSRGLDILNMILGIAMTVIGIIAFTDVQHKRWMFVFVFGIATIMALISVIYQIRNAPRGRKNWTGTILTFFLFLILAGLTIVSYVVLLKPLLIV